MASHAEAEARLGRRSSGRHGAWAEPARRGAASGAAATTPPRRGGGGISGFSAEDILSSLGPEARATAQNVFGRDLLGLETVEVGSTNRVFFLALTSQLTVTVHFV